MKNLSILFLSQFLFVFSACADLRMGGEYPPLQTEQAVNLTEYSGKWYELYKLPNKFEKGCYDVTADYTVLNDGSVRVINTCKLSKGKSKTARGRAFVINKKTNASLKVSFVPFFQRWGLFAGDYNIIKLGINYEHALVGSQNRKFLWVLSRSREISDDDLNYLLEYAQEQGFNIDQVEKTPSLDS